MYSPEGWAGKALLCYLVLCVNCHDIFTFWHKSTYIHSNSHLFQPVLVPLVCLPFCLFCFFPPSLRELASTSAQSSLSQYLTRFQDTDLEAVGCMPWWQGDGTTVCWLVHKVSVLSTVCLHSAGRRDVTKNRSQRAERCPYDMASDERHVPIRGTRKDLICFSRAGFLEEMMHESDPSLLISSNSWKGGLGTRTWLLTRQTFPTQPTSYGSWPGAASPSKRGRGSKECPADPPWVTSNKARQNAVIASLAIVPPTERHVLLLTKNETLTSRDRELLYDKNTTSLPGRIWDFQALKKNHHVFHE